MDLFLDARARVRPPWRALGFVLVYVLVLRGVVELFSADWPAAVPLEWLEAGLVLALSAFCLRAEGRGLRDLGLGLDRRWVIGWLLGTALGMAIIGAAALTAWAAGACSLHWDPQASGSRLLAGTGLYLAVSLNEELLFRGYAFQRVAEGLGPWPAQLLFAALFTLAHWGNPGMTGATRLWATLNIALAGLLLGQAWLRTRSLALPIGLHFGWNWTQGSLLGFGVSGTEGAGLLRPTFSGAPEWLSGGAFGLEAGLPCTLLTLAALALLLRRDPHPPEETP